MLKILIKAIINKLFDEISDAIKFVDDYRLIILEAKKKKKN